MRIQLKQNEIEEALKGYLGNQGIATQGKSVKMDFTSGRKNNGLSVEILIEDQVKSSLSETMAAAVAADPVPVAEPVEEAKPVSSLFGG